MWFQIATLEWERDRWKHRYTYYYKKQCVDGILTIIIIIIVIIIIIIITISYDK